MTADKRARRASTGRTRSHARGVTLLELMAVVTIIGIFVALAVPSMGGILQDRHAARAADELANMFRIARSRAAATGAVHSVKVAATGTSATFELRSAITGLVGGPVASCSGINWTTTDSRSLKKIDLAAGAFKDKSLNLVPTSGTGATAATSEYCFTPGGTPWVRTTGLWTRPLASSVARWTLDRGSNGGLTRTIRVSPTGLPSIEAE